MTDSENSFQDMIDALDNLPVALEEEAENHPIDRLYERYGILISYWGFRDLKKKIKKFGIPWEPTGNGGYIHQYRHKKFFIYPLIDPEGKIKTFMPWSIKYPRL